MSTKIKDDKVLLDLTSRVYKVVVEHGKKGVLQSELWKELSLTSRDGSRIAIRLEKRGMIKRDRMLQEGRWTYKLTPLRFPVQIKSIEEAPCMTCPDEERCSPAGVVTPLECILVESWVQSDRIDIPAKR
ncbi:MAG: transcriptional regulator [Thaumarchaeota archaeon]|nr:transcriptional regulator [Nitrososphaerota archaeon]